MRLPPRRPRAAIVRRASLALIATAAWLAGSPAAGQRSVPTHAPITTPFVADWTEAMPRLMGLFPPAAREAGITRGYASLKFRVMTDSTVDPASITVESQSRPEFAQPAREFVARTRFVPATVGGGPVAAWIREGVSFRDRREEPSGTYSTLVHDEPPVLLDAREMARLVETHYPPTLRDAGVTGSVLVELKVSPTGAVRPDRITVHLTTDPAFEEPAAAIVRMLRFRPARLDGMPVEGEILVPLHFGAVPGGG